MKRHEIQRCCHILRRRLNALPPSEQATLKQNQLSMLHWIDDQLRYEAVGVDKTMLPIAAIFVYRQFRRVGR